MAENSSILLLADRRFRLTSIWNVPSLQWNHSLRGTVFLDSYRRFGGSNSPAKMRFTGKLERAVQADAERPSV